jgi:anti-sigma B factor antagonist
VSSISPFEVYQAGTLTVIGFGKRDLPSDANIADCRDALIQLLHQNQCTGLAIDLTSVRTIPSGLLGVLASIHKLGIEVHLFNPSDDIREVISVTKLSQILHLHDLNIEP